MFKLTKERLKQLQEEARSRPRKPAPDPKKVKVAHMGEIARIRYKKPKGVVEIMKEEQAARREFKKQNPSRSRILAQERAIRREARKLKPKRKVKEEWRYIEKPVDWSKVNRYLYEIVD